MLNYGVIDLGSNSIRLVVYEVKGNGPGDCAPKSFESLINDKVMAGLAAYVSDGVFTEAGIEKAASVLRGHAKRARYFDCRRLDVFATAVLRNASNCQEAVDAIEKRSGLSIALLSAQDEAHLGFVGATWDRTVERGTLVDIGGGSTELTRIDGGRDFDNASMGQGSLSSFARYVRGILPTATESEAIACRLRARLGALPESRGPIAHRFSTASAAAFAPPPRCRRRPQADVVRPKSMTADEIRAILEWCHEDPDTFAHTALKASAERIHTLVPGCVILLALFEELGAERLEICKYGVREGYLIERMLS